MVRHSLLRPMPILACPVFAGAFSLRLSQKLLVCPLPSFSLGLTYIDAKSAFSQLADLLYPLLFLYQGSDVLSGMSDLGFWILHLSGIDSVLDLD